MPKSIAVRFLYNTQSNKPNNKLQIAFFDQITLIAAPKNLSLQLKNN
jgi:hypothetical protein